MAMYDQSLLLVNADKRARQAEDRARFFESSAERWRRAFDALASCLDDEDPLTQEALEFAERARQEIPLEYAEGSG